MVGAVVKITSCLRDKTFFILMSEIDNVKLREQESKMDMIDNRTLLSFCLKNTSWQRRLVVFLDEKLKCSGNLIFEESLTKELINSIEREALTNKFILVITSFIS